MDRFSHACKECGLTSSIKPTNVMGQDVKAPPSIHIDNMTLDVVDHFTHIDSTITSNLFIDTEINMRVAKAAAVMFKLDKGATQRRHKTRKF